MVTVRLTRKRLREGVRLPTGERHRILLQPEVVLLRIIGDCFD